MTRIILETSYDAPFSDQDWDEEQTKLSPCLQERDIRWIRSFVSPDRRRTVCEFEAPDAEMLRDALRRVGASYDKLWVAEVREP
jgi:Protein of unknown function (DUF4242)